jgi:hypothetical protein
MFFKLLRELHPEEHQAYQFRHNHQYLQLAQREVLIQAPLPVVLGDLALLLLRQELVPQELL